MRKICVVITARPSYSRIKTVLTAIKLHPDLHLQLVITGSALLERYGSVISQIEKDGFEIAAKLTNVVEGNTPAVSVKTTGLAMIELATLFECIKPDVIITVADRFETLATAASAAYMNIPLIHIQGGEVTGNIDDKVRHAVSQLADIHFVASENAAKRVIRMGIDAARVYNTGCPSIDIAAGIMDNPLLDFDPFEEYGGVGATFDYKGKYLVVMQHPVTTEYAFSRNQIELTFEAIEKLGIPAFWFWPNPDPGTEGIAKGIRSFREHTGSRLIHYFRNMEPRHFLKLLKNSVCLIGNSSAGIRECSFLGVPVVNIGSRQEGRQRADNVIDVDYDTDAIVQAVTYQAVQGGYNQSFMYGKGDSSQKIASLLASVSFVPDKLVMHG